MYIEPHERQWNAIKATVDYLNEQPGNPICAMPPGTGKSVIIAGLIRVTTHMYGPLRVIVLAHVKELIEQNYSKLLAMWPTAPAGIYSAALGRRDLNQIIFGGVASLYERAREIGFVNIVVVDECHLVSNKDSTMYMTLIAELKLINPHLRVVGLSATPYRLASGWLTDQGIFNACPWDDTTLDNFNWYIHNGWLKRLIPKPTTTLLNVDGVETVAGDYHRGQLEDAVDQEQITRAAIEETLAFAGNRRSWLIFGTGVNHCMHIADILADYGVSCAVVSNKTSNEDRKKFIDMFRAGKLTALVNNNLLTTGFDYTGIDLIAVLRPTKSPGLWVQMLGRGIRAHYIPGFIIPNSTAEQRLYAIGSSSAPDCLVLDFAGNSWRLGPINDPTLPEKKKRKRAGGHSGAPIKVCPHCVTFVHAALRFCDNCGHEFPHIINMLEAHASTSELIREGAPVAPFEEAIVEPFDVSRVVYNHHEKAGKIIFRVSYWCGYRRFSEYICIEHDGHARDKAVMWWKKMSGNPHIPAPLTVDEAMTRSAEIRVPRRINVWINRKHPKVQDHEF